MFLRSLRRLIQLASASCKHSRPTARKRAPGFKLRLEALEHRWLPSTVSWVNTAGGNWSTASNWSTGRLPGILDDVVIDVSGDVTITHSSGTDLVHSLTSNDRLAVSGGYLNVADASTLNSTLTLSGGTLTGRGDLTINDVFTWTGGTMGGRGSTHANGGMTISSNNGKTLDARTLDYTGTATWSDTGGIALVNDATWNNLAGATLQATGDATLSGGAGTFNNAGTFSKSAGTGTTTLSSILNNTGTIDAASGTVNVAGADTATGTFTVETGATLAFNGGTQALAAASSVSGAGDVTFGGANLTLLGSYAITGNTTVSNGTVLFDADTTLPTLTLSGGTLGGVGTLTVSGTLTWTGGEMNNGGRTVANGGMTISGNNGKALRNRVLDNAGTATWTGTGSIAMDGNAVWNNLAGSQIDAQNDAVFGNTGGGGEYFDSIFNNAGTFKKSAGTGTTTITAFVSNTGTIDAASGTLKMTEGGLNDSMYVAETAATLELSGGSQAAGANSSITGAGNVTFSGATVNVAGSYTVTGTTTVTGGTVTFANDTTVAALTLSGGTLMGDGNMTVSGLVTWTGGTMQGGGHTIANGGMAISGNNGKTLDARTLDNAGTATWTGTGNIGMNNDAVWNNLAGSVLDAQNDATIGGGSATFNNAGTFQKSAGTATTTLSAYLNNSGTVDAASGTISLPGGGFNTGTYTVEAGAALLFGGGTQSLRAGSSVSGAGNVTFSGANATLAGTYTVTGTTTISNGTVSFDNNAAVPALTFSNGTLTGASDLTVSTQLTWTGGTMTGAGRTISNGTMTISGGGKQLIGRTLTNAGTTTWTGTGDINVMYDAIWNNQSGAVMDVQGDARFGTDSIFHAQGVFNNAGTFKKSAGSGTTHGMLTFNNTGTVDAASGILDLDGGGLSSGTFTTETGATLEFSGGSPFLMSASSVSGAGNVIFDSETFNNLHMTIAGSYNVTGTTTFQSAAGSAPPVEFDHDATMATLNLGTGTLSGAGTVTVTGTLNWTGGTLSGDGQLVTSGSMAISGSGGKNLDGRTLNNAGTVTWTGGGNINGGNNAVFNNQSGAVFDAQTDATLGGGIVFNNAGTFKKSAGTGTTTVNALFSNTGTLDVETGTVKLGGTFTNFDSTAALLADGTYLVKGTLQFNNAQITTNQAKIILDGSAAKIVNQSNVNALATFANNLDGASFTIRNGANVTTAGDFNNLGTLLLGPNSHFNVSGNYTQIAGGALEVQLCGTPASGQFGLLAVTGTANLDGTLTVSLTSGYTPSPGDSFQVLTFSGSTGDFATTNLPAGASLALDPHDVTVSF
jgi:hypothetical protein